MGAILTLLLIATPSIYSLNSSLQQEFSIQTMGNILTQDNFEETIFFKYGAESGELEPPFDYAGADGTGSKEDAGVEVSTTHARTGTQSVRMYQGDPLKSDAQRRTEAGYYSHSETEFYWSFWAYFPTGYDDVAEGASWLNTGGITLYWGDDDNDDGARWSKGLRSRFAMGTDGTGLYTRGTWTANDMTDDWLSGDDEFWYEGDKHYLTLNAWHHFQIYMYQHPTNGIIRAWVDNVLNLEMTSQHTHPSYWGEPEAGDDWSHWHGYYSLDLCQYGYYDTPALEVWYDDIVAATEKVSVTYEVYS
jgi:hypothetical protein